MARVNATEFTEKWQRRLKAAAPDIRRGIERVTESPGVRAAKSKDLMKSRLNAAIDDGTWERRVGAVTTEDWKKAASGKGVDRISAGVDGAQGKVQDMAEKLLVAVDQSVQEVNKVPKGDIEASVNRAATFMRAMNKRKLRRA